MKRGLLGVVLAIVVGGCASANETNKARPAHEVVSGAGRIRGGGMRMDVSIGHSLVQRPVKGNKQVIKQGVVTP